MITPLFLLSLLRGVHVDAMLSGFGTAMFAGVIGTDPRFAATAEKALAGRYLAWLAGISLAISLLLGTVWLILETAVIAGVGSVAATLHFLPIVVLHTQFGGWLALRLLLLAIALLLLLVRQWSDPTARMLMLPTACAVAIQPMLGHPGAETGTLGSVLIAGSAVHLVAVGAWLGALMPLWFYVRCLPPAGAARACARFSRFGLVAVCLIAATGLVLAIGLVGSLAALVATTYGQLVLLKIALFTLALLLAALNRYALTGRLAGPRRNPHTRRMLLGSIGTEAAIGAAIVLVAAVLAGEVPSVDLVQHAHAAGMMSGHMHH